MSTNGIFNRKFVSKFLFCKSRVRKVLGMVSVLKIVFCRETIGIKLLMKMGWKSGQGVGPRLSKSEKSASKKGHKAVRIYGCSLPPNQVEQPNVTSGDTTSEEEEDETIEGITFAPDDYEPYVVKPKDNCFGLGYSGLNRKPVLSSHVNLFEPSGPSLVMEEKKKKVSIRGQVRTNQAKTTFIF